MKNPFQIMKTIAILLLICSLFCTRLVAQNEASTSIKTNIHAVKLHLQGAEVMRKTSVNLKAGRNHLVFTNLSPKLYEQTIQVTTSKQVKVISVTSKQNFIERRQATPQIKSLNDSLEILRDAIALLENERGSYEEEQGLLKQNRSMKSSQQNLTVAELQSMSEFYRKRNFDINKNITRLTKSIATLNRQVFNHKLQLYELNADKRAMAEIFLVVEAEVTGSTDFDLRYVVSDAGWAAIYDLEASNFASTINLEYRALTYNNTGIDWNDVELTLSTGDPLQSMLQPSLSVWNLAGSSSYQINTSSAFFDISGTMFSYCIVSKIKSLSLFK